MAEIYETLVQTPFEGSLAGLEPGRAVTSDATPAERLGAHLRVIRRRWWVVLLVVTATTLAATAYAIQQPKRYDAVATLYFPQTQPLAAALGTPVSQPADTEREANTNVSLVTSSSVAAAVIRQLRLDTPIPDLLKEVRAAVSSNSDLVSVAATQPSPGKAATLANAFAQQAIAFRAAAAQNELTQAIKQATEALSALTPAQQKQQQGQLLLARLQQLQTAKALQTGPAQLLQSATPPASASSPHPKRSAALGFGLGLLLAVALALILDRLDHRLRDEDQIAAAVGAPILAVLPRDPQRRSSRSAAPSQALDSLQRRATAMLASSLRLRGWDSGTLVVSGVAADDSHARVTLGLAASLAIAGRGVMIIQLGPMGSGIDRLLGLVDRPGLGSVLAQPGQLSETLVPVSATRLHVVADSDGPEPSIAVLPIGYASAEYEELSGEAMLTVLSIARSLADCVLVSASTVGEPLAFITPSAALLLVVRRNGTTTEATAEAVTALHNARLRAHGAVITNGDPKHLADLRRD